MMESDEVTFKRSSLFYVLPSSKRVNYVDIVLTNGPVTLRGKVQLGLLLGQLKRNGVWDELQEYEQ
jgi:hypothetical protein